MKYSYMHIINLHLKVMTRGEGVKVTPVDTYIRRMNSF